MVLDVIDGWEVRVFEPLGHALRNQGSKGFDHLQLWHPSAGVSLLTPSILTGHQFEVYPLADWKYSESNYGTLWQLVREVLHLTLPRPSVVETLLEVFTEVYEEGAGVDSGTHRVLVEGNIVPALLPSK